MPRARARNDVRSRIAHAAARIMAQDGIEDYALAKRKAARQSGVADSRELPTNEEIDVALREYQTLYGHGEQRLRLKRLREIALRVMRDLQQFNPYLTGSVLSGSAGKYADIDLQLFTDSVKAVELHLLNRGMPYKTAQQRLYSGDDACLVPVFTLQIDDIPVRMEVLTLQDLRRPLRRSAAGKALERAKTEIVETLVEED